MWVSADAPAPQKRPFLHMDWAQLVCKARHSLKSILIADAELLFAEALHAALEGPDFSIAADHPLTGLDAVKAVLHHRPDVALIDYWLEGMNGPAATRIILRRSPGTKVLLLSWFQGERESRESAFAGATALVSKGVELEQLVSTILIVGNLAHPPAPVRARPSAGSAEAPADPTWEAQERLLSLTLREIEVLGLLAGHSPKAIAKSLGVSLGTVRNHIHQVTTKLQARTQLEAVDLARSFGFI